MAKERRNEPVGGYPGPEPDSTLRKCQRCLCWRPREEFKSRGRLCYQCQEPEEGLDSWKTGRPWHDSTEAGEIGGYDINGNFVDSPEPGEAGRPTEACPARWEGGPHRWEPGAHGSPEWCYYCDAERNQATASKEDKMHWVPAGTVITADLLRSLHISQDLDHGPTLQVDIYADGRVTVQVVDATGERM